MKLNEAFSKFGAVARNSRWSWVATTDDGEYVFTMWQHLMRVENGKLIANTGDCVTGKKATPGRVEWIQALHDVSERGVKIVSVVCIIAKDKMADDWEIADAFPMRFAFHVDELNLATGSITLSSI